jgi:uncharacterized protein YdaU (DUF1376 family)
LNYYEHHLGDYVRDTAHLSILEDGVYRRLMDSCYINEAPLPLDVGECCKIARAVTKRERAAVAYILKQFFKPLKDGHHQPRIDEEIERYRVKSGKARKSANARWSNANAMRTHESENANASPSICESHANDMLSSPQSPVPSHQSPNKDTEKEVPGLDLDTWNRWIEYRKQIKKPLKPVSLSAAMLELAKFADEQAAVVQQSIASGWTGLFPIKAVNGTASTVRPFRRKTADELEAEEANAKH